MRKTFKPSFEEEIRFWKKGYTVIGIDEVGKGAFAGPVVVGAVVFSSSCHTEFISASITIDDSKRLSPNQRVKASKWIKENCASFNITEVGVSIINKYGIGKATKIAFRRTLNQLQRNPHFSNDSNHRSAKQLFVLIDGFHVRYIKGIGLKNQKAIIKGDQKSLSIAAASIIAKVHRDKLMRAIHKKYPQYGFAKHKGYGTKLHQAAIKKYGLCKLHRKSFTFSCLS